MTFTTPVWHIVAQYLPAQPVLHMRMATVNRQFYEVFMSDQVWARVDVYGVEEHISKHYLDMNLPDNKQLDFLRRLYDGKFDPEGDAEFAQLDWMLDHLYALYQAFTVPRLGKPFLYWRLNPSRCVLKIMSESGRVWQLSEDGKSDRTLALAAVSYNGLKLAQLPENLKRDREIVLAAVRNNGMALEFANRDLRQDEEVLHAAVFQNGLALRWGPRVAEFGTAASAASDRIVLTAIRNNSRALGYLKAGAMVHPDCFSVALESDRALYRVNNPVCDPSRAWVVSRPCTAIEHSFRV